MPTRRQHPPHYRREEVDLIARKWQHGLSCSIVGVGSAGKSNLLQHLLEPTTRSIYLGETAAMLYPVVIDSNLLGPLTPLDQPDAEQMRCWSGYELMLHQTYMALYPFRQLSAETNERFRASYTALHEGGNPLLSYMALRYFELALSALIDSGLRLVFIFDEFDEMLYQLPPRFFQALRGLRDGHKRRLSYTAFTRSPLPILTEQMRRQAALEPFTELFTDHLIYLGPFNQTDADQMLAELNEKVDPRWPAEMLALLRQATGGYAGMLRAGFSALPALSHTITTPEQMAAFLVTFPAPVTEVVTLWKGLTVSEQKLLKAVSMQRKYTITDETRSALQMLLQKRLLRLDRNTDPALSIQPPLLAEFIRRDPPLL